MRSETWQDRLKKLEKNLGNKVMNGENYQGREERAVQQYIYRRVLQRTSFFVMEE